MEEIDMPSPRLIATDLDETLLDSSGKISDENMKALTMAMEQGTAVTICTGRMFHSARIFALQLGLKNPIVCYNGAMLAHPLTEEIITHTPLELNLAKKILKYFKEKGLYVQSYVGDILYAKDESELEFLNYERYFGIRGKAIGDSLYDPQVAPTKFLAMVDSEEKSLLVIDELKNNFGEEVYIARSNFEFIEIMDKSVNKGRGLAALASGMGIAMNEVLAIGDGENDAEMIEEAGIGIAVGNASQKAKDAAGWIAPSNNENGVAWAVEKFVLRK